MKNEVNLPWEIGWYQLKDNNLLLLKNNLLKELIDRNVKKHGSVNKVAKITGLTHPTLYLAKSGKVNMVSVRKLKRLSDSAGIDYEVFDNNILELRKGKIKSIKNPIFPINLKTPEIGTILGFLCSDGWIRIDKKAGMAKRVLYSSDDQEVLDIFIKSIRKIFGEVHFQRETKRGHIRIRIGSSIIGDALERVGGIVGNKTKANKPVPWIVKGGSFDIKKEYLRAAFSDEGSIGRLHAPYIILSRYNFLNLSHSEKSILDKYIEPQMKIEKFPTGHIYKRSSFKKAIGIIKNLNIKSTDKLIKFLSENIPQLLIDESEILRKNFGIDNTIWIRSLNKTGTGYYTLGCDLIIRKKDDVIKFYKNVGFILSRKQEKLGKYLSERGWI